MCPLRTLWNVYFLTLFYHSSNSYHLRNADNKLALPLPKIEFLKKSFSYNGARVWNSLPNEIRNCEALSMFDKLISTYRPNVI